MNFIINPNNNERISIFSNKGKQLLKSYVKQFIGGSQASFEKRLQKLKKFVFKTQLDKITNPFDLLDLYDSLYEKEIIEKFFDLTGIVFKKGATDTTKGTLKTTFDEFYDKLTTVKSELMTYTDGNGNEHDYDNLLHYIIENIDDEESIKDLIKSIMNKTDTKG